MIRVTEHYVRNVVFRQHGMKRQRGAFHVRCDGVPRIRYGTLLAFAFFPYFVRPFHVASGTVAPSTNERLPGAYLPVFTMTSDVQHSRSRTMGTFRRFHMRLPVRCQTSRVFRMNTHTNIRFRRSSINRIKLIDAPVYARACVARTCVCACSPVSRLTCVSYCVVRVMCFPIHSHAQRTWRAREAIFVRFFRTPASY